MTSLVETLEAARNALRGIDAAGGLRALNKLTSEQIHARGDLQRLRELAKQALEADRQARGIVRDLLRAGHHISGSVPVSLADIEKRLRSERHLLRRLLDLCSEISFAEFLGEASDWIEDVDVRDPIVKRTLSAALDYWEYTIEDDDPRRDDFDFSGATDVADAAWFAPDQWLSNESALRPVLLSAPVAIPRPLRERMRQLYASFLFGQWLATIALARSTLEYVLWTEANVLGIDVRSQPFELGSMIRVYAQRFPALEEPMKYIWRAGNEVMHELRDATVLRFPQGRDMALKSVHLLSDVIRSVMRRGTADSSGSA